jgi:hypothetical protein
MPPKRDKKGKVIVKDDGVVWPWRRFAAAPPSLRDKQLLNTAPSANGSNGKRGGMPSRP